MGLASLAPLVVVLGLAQAAVPTPTDMQRSVAPLVDSVKDSVVTIRSIKLITRARREDMFTRLLRERMGLPQAPSGPPERHQNGLGSGFIVSPKGIIYTNNHVVAGANEIEVVTSDGRVFAATVVGTDPKTDVAVVLMKKPPANLKVARLGNSDAVRVGDYVLAIGNPLGLGQTVTMGIVSAKDRTVDGLDNLAAFIQTDAAINQGNSGGPLFNFAGEVIGVNSAILNPAMAMNVGFAIPINLARNIARQIQDKGTVGRGYLGVTTQPMTPELVQRLRAETDAGALVNMVVPSTPAAKAGLRVNDVILEVAGRRIETPSTLSQVIASRSPGEQVPVTVLRGGKRLTLQVVLDDLTITGEQVLGMSVQRLSAQEAGALGLPSGSGVKVLQVDPRGPLSGTLQEGDLVVAVVTTRQTAATVDNLRAFETWVKRGRRGQLVIVRDGEPFALNF